MSLIRLILPRPPQGYIWCTACVAFYKARFVAHHQEALTELDKDGLNDLVDFKKDGTEDCGMLEIAVTESLWMNMTSVYPGPVPMCWNHAMPVQIQVTNVVPAAAGSEEVVAQQLQAMGAKVIGAPKTRERESHFPGRAGG